MREHPRPTRASDVANAIYDGTNAVMLSGQTAIGRYRVEAVGYTSRIAVEAEAHLGLVDRPPCDPALVGSAVDDHVSELAVALAGRVNADAIITPTLSGRTARLLARHRPPGPSSPPPRPRPSSGAWPSSGASSRCSWSTPNDPATTGSGQRYTRRSRPGRFQSSRSWLCWPATRLKVGNGRPLFGSSESASAGARGSREAHSGGMPRNPFHSREAAGCSILRQ
jgi:hypothetical protein